MVKKLSNRLVKELSNRHKEVLQMICLKNKLITSYHTYYLLRLTQNTDRRHLKKIYLNGGLQAKSGVMSRVKNFAGICVGIGKAYQTYNHFLNNQSFSWYFFDSIFTELY